MSLNTVGARIETDARQCFLVGAGAVDLVEEATAS